MVKTAATARQRTLIDAHVHLHHPAHAVQHLRLAADGFATVGNRDVPAVVMLAERAGYDAFRLLQAQLDASGEPDSLWFRHGNQRLLVVAGRQIVTAERLEVLGLATHLPIPDGLPVQQVLARLEAADAIAVLPWGVGKWLGNRGRIVDSLLAAAQPGRLFLGDNGGRPGWWPVPQFSRGTPVLAGSDPLPLPGSARTIGRFGSAVEGRLPEQEPAAYLKRVLRDPATRIATYGRPAPSLRFIADQMRLRFFRHPMEPA